MSSGESPAWSERPLRVAHIVPRYSPVIGGVERQAEAICRGLARRGVEVEVITTDPSRELTPVEHLDGVTVRRFPTIASDSVYFLSPWLGAWLRHNAARFDVLHAHSYHTPLALQAAITARRRGMPFVLTPVYHGTGHSRFRSALHVPYRLFGARLMRAGQVVCISSAERELVERHFAEASVKVIPSGIDVEEVRQAQPHPRQAGRKLVLAVSRLEGYKGVDLVLRALPHLASDVDLLVIGQGPAKDELVREATALGVDGRVRFLANLDRPDLLGWYRSADVFVTLSKHESFGLSLLEAAAGGCALVASDIPAHRDVAALSDAPVTFSGLNASTEEVAASLSCALRAGRRTSDCAQLPTWDQHVDQLLGCYESLLRSKSCAS